MGKWSLERWLTVGAVVFTLGMNWQRVWSQQEDIDALKLYQTKTLPELYVPREIYDLNQRYLIEAINKLTKAVESANWEIKTGEPPRIQRQFDK